MENCKFYATGGGTVQTYGSCNPPEHNVVYFKVKLGTKYLFEPIYLLEDCAGNGWDESGCTTEQTTTHTYSSPHGGVATESSYGTTCQNTFTGSASDPVQFGTPSTAPLQGEDSTGVWAIRDLDKDGATCNDYKESAYDDAMFTWDSRN